ncbi:MAG: leucine-rich repeat protein, partial [Lachnospiraceae bacterium]|nr:leucine-rich repeat protein [Lachnospiraceae bacterium]
GDEALKNGEGFTGSLTISDNVETIGQHAFEGCSGFDGRLIIGNKVRGIGEHAFDGCNGFTGCLTIPERIEWLREETFKDCTGLTKIINLNWASIELPQVSGKTWTVLSDDYAGDNILRGRLTAVRSDYTPLVFSYDDRERTAVVVGYTEETKDLVIPDTDPVKGYKVVAIGDEALKNGERFTGSLTISDNVETIGQHAFDGCSRFDGRLIIGNKVREIGEHAFDGCHGFTGCLTIPESIEWLRGETFKDCTGLTKIINLNMASIGLPQVPEKTWRNISDDQEIFHDLDGGHTAIRSDYSVLTFSYDDTAGIATVTGCTEEINKLVIPPVDPVKGYRIVAIEDNAFKGCVNFKNLIMGDNLKHIGANAFDGCSGFTGDLIIPESVEKIGAEAFNGCSGFTGKLVIPHRMSEISDDAAFSGMFSISEIKNDSVQRLKASWFIENESSPEVFVNDIEEVFKYDSMIGSGEYKRAKDISGAVVTGVVNKKYTGTEIIQSPKVKLEDRELIPETDYTISYLNNINAGKATMIFTGTGDYCGSKTVEFNIYNNYELTYEITNDNTIRITGYTGVQTGPLVIPSEIDGKPVTEIGNAAFKGCDDFTGPLSLPASITSIGNEAFRSCSGFTGSLVLPQNLKTIGNSAFSSCTRFTGNLLIPGTVETVGEYAFSGCDALKGTLTISGGVKSLKYGAFCNCTGFSGPLVLPATLKYIGPYVFSNCRGLTGGISVPGNVEIINDHAFKNCTGFNGNLVLSNGIKVIGEGAFDSCSNLSGNIVLPNTITTMGEAVFRGCAGFVGTPTIPSSLKIIPALTFKYCSGLSGTVTIPSTVEEIGAEAFSGCNGLSGCLAIPGSVKKIGIEAFRDCSNISSLILPNNIREIGEGAFNNCTSIESIDNNSVRTLKAGWFIMNQKDYFSSETGEKITQTGVIETGTYVKHKVYSILTKYIYMTGRFISDISGGITGTAATISAIPNEGYRFVEWNLEGIELPEDDKTRNPLTITIGKDDVVLNGKFERIPHMITVNTDGNGTAEAGLTSAVEGTTCRIMSHPNSGYKFKEWRIVSGNVVLSDASKDPAYITIKDTDVEIQACFEEDTPEIYSVSVNTNSEKYGNASADPEEGETGTIVMLEAEPNEGYKFVEWKVNSGGISLVNKNKASTAFVIKNSNVDVTAIFEEKDDTSLTPVPTETPANAPTNVPTPVPTETPTNAPTNVPTPIPTQTPTPEKISIENAKVILSKTSFKYTGKKQRPTIKQIGDKELVRGTDYTAKWSDTLSKDAGKYTITITGKGNYIGKTTATYTIKKAKNTLKVVAKKDTYKVTYSKLKNKTQSIKATKIYKYTSINKTIGDLSYELSTAKKGKKDFSKSFVINKKTGKIKIKKGLKKGSYKIKVKVTAAGDKNYKNVTKAVAFTIKVN